MDDRPCYLLDYVTGLGESFLALCRQLRECGGVDSPNNGDQRNHRERDESQLPYSGEAHNEPGNKCRHVVQEIAQLRKDQEIRMSRSRNTQKSMIESSHFSCEVETFSLMAS